jgi:hypothetical protein
VARRALLALMLSGCTEPATTPPSVILGSQAKLVDGWSGVFQEGMGPLVDPPSADESRERVCTAARGNRDTCSGAPPWVVTFSHDEIHGHRVVAPQPNGRLAIGPIVWEHEGEPQCRYHENLQLRVVDGEILLSIQWEGSGLAEVCEPQGCTSGHMDCYCYFNCLPMQRGVCDLVLDPETLSKVEQRGDCPGPPST